MSAKTYKHIRCKTRSGISCRWTIGRSNGGGFKAISVGQAKMCGRPIPSDFLPFEVMDAVMNRNIRFDSMEEAETYVRAL